MKLTTIASSITRLDEKLKNSIVASELVNTLALKESVQSTRIEGTQVTFTDMINETHSQRKRQDHIEVLNYRRTLFMGQERIQNGYPITTLFILDLHKILMEGGKGTKANRLINKIGIDGLSFS